MSYVKVLSLPSLPSESWDVGALKYFMGNLNPLIETKILAGRKKKISVMIRYSELGIHKSVSHFEKKEILNTVSSQIRRGVCVCVCV